MFMFLILNLHPSFFFFFFNDTATTEIYTLSLHDALPISIAFHSLEDRRVKHFIAERVRGCICPPDALRSEEHTSELQSQSNLVCRLLLEKKKKTAQDKRKRLECQGHASGQEPNSLYIYHD